MQKRRFFLSEPVAFRQVYGSWDLLADQRGIKPPPAVCQGEKSVAVLTEPRARLKCKNDKPSKPLANKLMIVLPQTKNCFLLENAWKDGSTSMTKQCFSGIEKSVFRSNWLKSSATEMTWMQWHANHSRLFWRQSCLCKRSGRRSCWGCSKTSVKFVWLHFHSCYYVIGLYHSIPAGQQITLHRRKENRNRVEKGGTISVYKNFNGTPAHLPLEPGLLSEMWKSKDWINVWKIWHDKVSSCLVSFRKNQETQKNMLRHVSRGDLGASGWGEPWFPHSAVLLYSQPRYGDVRDVVFRVFYCCSAIPK